MLGYATRQQRIAIAGADDLIVRSLLDRQQFFDPLGVAERLGISSATWPMFGLLWPSGAELAARLISRAPRRGERILEIGCGLALPSLAGHRRGQDITASDCHPLAGDFLACNAALNGLPPLPYRHGHWAVRSAIEHPCDGVAAPLHGRFDLIIGSDLLYERDEGGALAAFVGRHATDSAEVWIVDPDRSNRPAFHRRMAALGFAVLEERLDRPASGEHEAYKGRLLTYRRQ
ncbi:MAG: SAM-dependent methyltransferase [Caldimonas sp.]